jgi:site-specific DNA-methyltransferase (adenine-specific)
MTYPDDFINKIICGDSQEVLKDIPENSVDSIVTDPPAGINL